MSEDEQRNIKLRMKLARFLPEQDKISQRSRFGLFSQPLSTGVGDTSYDKSKP